MKSPQAENQKKFNDDPKSQKRKYQKEPQSVSEHSAKTKQEKEDKGNDVRKINKSGPKLQKDKTNRNIEPKK